MSAEREVRWLFDRLGKASLRLVDDKYFISFQGRHVGFVNSSRIYNYNGSHVGWFECGILRDLFGKCVAFENKVSDVRHPAFPICRNVFTRLTVRTKPISPVRHISFAKPVNQSTWSVFSPKRIFG